MLSGWAIAVLGFIYFYFWLEKDNLIGAILSVVSGLFVVAFGESIGVLFVIEENTRAVANGTNSEGKDTSLECSECNAKITHNAKFCQNCGVQFD